MRKFLHLIIAALTISTPCFAEETPTHTPKILIAYYSWSGNTEKVANAIQNKVGGTLFRIDTVESYPEEYKKTTAQAKKEINEGFHPKLKNTVENIGQYDIIFIGSPNWWGTIAPAVSTFLASYNLKGKKIIPFITHGGGGEQNTLTDLKKQCVGCDVAENGWTSYKGFTIGLNRWLKKQGF